MTVIIDLKVHEAIENFYSAALNLHPALDIAVVEQKKERLYAALKFLQVNPYIYPLARYKRVWRAKRYRELIAEDFHFAFKIHNDENGNPYVLIYDATHSLLYHD
ncbi:MAG: hypothetical protein IJ814_02520 [Paludibacteraceae bacterium]|nr:hypothetical protein [Paludibacteraceae bacterium]